MKKIELEAAGREVLAASRTELYIDMRFFGAALNSLGYEMDLSTTTVGTDAVNIRFNPAFVARLFVEEPGKLNRTYLHMLLHCIFRHMYTSAKYEDTRLYDLCADIVTESVLDGFDYQCIYRVSSDYRDRWISLLEKEVKVLTVERLYRFFTERENELDIFEMEKLEREFALDDHSFWLRLEDNEDNSEDSNKDKDKEEPPIDEDYNSPFDNKDGKKTEKYINPRRLQKIRHNEKNWEKEAKRLQTEIETIGKQSSDRLGKLAWILKIENTSRTDYREFLRKFKILREEGGIDLDSFDYGMYSFGLEFYGDMPLIEENEFREVKKIQELVIAIDTSASCKDELVQRFLNETAAMLLTEENFFRKINIRIIECDDQVQREEIITSVDDMKKFAKGIHVEGGYGTDFRPVFTRVSKLIDSHEFENLKGLIYFTDGFGIYPDKPTSYDTAFVFPQDEEYDDEKVPDWALKLYI
ncbi:VWA-like domain-containing protein [Butyrivibrio sp. DSM 10294]|uniref:vWA domain-containing protein n=1 Tax=Butyrivibrio sp. DSM 10294 TaxID=2972457 RepID=UPI00234F353C|nr:VWA-like domain-containing protein [Butyrivibrio sp. DSM 10294]MDC7294782.1 VWA-like domain-containing protein [Butyrivibrio sp. DSM 10294]